jgi:hypothetical protein
MAMVSSCVGLQSYDTNCLEVLRIVDNKAVLYFDAPTASKALEWYRGQSCLPHAQGNYLCIHHIAININIPASKT